MHLFLTTVVPFLAHDHPSVVAFLTCRHHNFHSSIVPEFLSDEERVKSFCEARQQNELEVDKETEYETLYNLFIQTPLMQFSPSLLLCQKDCAESIVKPLLETKYFTRSLQRCSVILGVPLSKKLLQALSKVRSLTELDLSESEVTNEFLEIIINSFPSLETLTIGRARQLKTALRISSPPPSAKKTLRKLTLRNVEFLFVAQFVPNFINLMKLELSGQNPRKDLDLLPLSSSLPVLTNISLKNFILGNTESLKDLVHLSSLEFIRCRVPDLNFLTQENSLPHLTTLHIDDCSGLSSSQFASLAHVPNLHALQLNSSEFDTDCLKYLENMVHLRKLDLSGCNILGDTRSLKTVMQNLFQLEELNLEQCNIGNQGAIAGALYSTHSRLRVLNLSWCNLVDDDLNGIGALKNTLEVLDLSYNYELTNESLVHCRDLHTLFGINLDSCVRINDLSPLKACLSLEEIDVSECEEFEGVADDAFKFELLMTGPKGLRVNPAIRGYASVT